MNEDRSTELKQLIHRLLQVVNGHLRLAGVAGWVFGLGGMAFAIWYFSDIFTYVIISLVITSLLRTPTNYINNLTLFSLKVPRFLAIVISFTVLVSLIGLFVTLFIPLIKNQIEGIAKINEWDALIEKPVGEIEDLFQKHIDPDAEDGFIIASIQQGISQLVSIDKLSDGLASLLSLSGTFLIGLMAVLFITFFLLYERGAVRRYFISLIPNRYFEVSISAINKVERLLSNYLFGLLMQMVSIFTVGSLGLVIAGVDYAVTIAAFAAVANVIPFLGPLLGAVFGIIISVGLFVTETVNSGTDISGIPLQTYAFLVGKIVLVFGVVQFTDNVLLQPLIFSRSVKAHPLEIFLIIFVGSNIAGLVGMVAAIPTYTLIKVSFNEIYGGYKQYQIFRKE